MAVLIDASILIEVERGRLGLEGHVQRHGEDEGCGQLAEAISGH